jgi:hypothetical protein
MTAHMKLRSSTEIRADIDTLKKERASAEARLGELEATYNDVLLNGTDKEAEKHEAESAKQRRAVQRADLRLPPLEDELQDALEREERERFAEQQERARKAVQDIIARAETEYAVPAAKIASFLKDWEAATDLAEAAKIDPPNSVLRCRPARMGEPTTQEVVVYTNRFRHVSERLPPADDPNGPWEASVRTKVVPPVMVPGDYLPDLATSVALPPLKLNDRAIWARAMKEI